MQQRMDPRFHGGDLRGEGGDVGGGGDDQAKNRSVDKSPNYWYTGPVAVKAGYPGKQPTIVYRFTRGMLQDLLDKILGWSSS